MKHGWEYKKLGDCFSYIKNGANIKQDKSGLGFPITRIETLSSGRFNRDKVGFAGITDIEKYRAYVLNDKDLLMSHINSKAYIGRTVLYRKEGDESIIHGMNLLRLVANEKIDSCYFAALAQSTYFKEQIAKIRKDAVNQSSFAISDLQKIQIPVPPLPVQEQICSLLDKLNLIIEKKKEQVAELDNLAQSLFYDMFGDPVENGKGWDSKPISSIGELSRGVSKHRPRNAPELLGGTMPLIQTGDVSNSGMYIRDYSSTYSELGVLQSRVWHKGTLCITIAANIGKCSILTFDACFPDSVVGFIPYDNALVEYMFFAFSAIQKTLEENAMGVAQKNINLAILNQLVLAVPPIEIQQAFAEKVKAIEQQKELINQSIKDVQTLFDAKMDYYFGD